VIFEERPSGGEGGRTVIEAVELEQEELQNVNEAITEEVAAIEDDDIERYLAVLADDAVFLPPKLGSLGGEELRQWLSDFLGQWRVEWLAYKDKETEICGDLAFHRFTFSWRLEPKNGGEFHVSHRKGMHILRRLSDGSWKIAREVWNGRPTPITI
jgi:ketosteroid isomerase-like protein